MPDAQEALGEQIIFFLLPSPRKGIGWLVGWFLNKFHLFICKLWLHWVFVVAHGLSLVNSRRKLL